MAVHFLFGQGQLFFSNETLRKSPSRETRTEVNYRNSLNSIDKNISFLILFGASNSTGE